VGHTIWIDTKGRPEAEHTDMSVLLRLDKELDALAEKLGVEKLTNFYDYSVLQDEYGDLDEAGEEDADETGEESETPAGSWFDSAKGLQTVKALRSQLLKDFSALSWAPDESRRHWPQSLLEDLELCESTLSEAVANGWQFRLLIVP